MGLEVDPAGTAGWVSRPRRRAGTVFGATTDADTVRSRLSVLTQNPADYLFNPTVREDLAYGPAQLDCERAEVTAASSESRTGLTSMASCRSRRSDSAAANSVEPPSPARSPSSPTYGCSMSR